MRVPLATYRLQFGGEVTFRRARELVPYLEALGITDLYASPLLIARAGSAHGYDVTDPVHLNPALGTEEEFRELVAALRERGMGLLLDIVPNHMAASPENPWWTDVLENGPASPYASFFDIEWRSRDVPGLDGKLLVPVLGGPYAEVLEKGELVLSLDAEGLFVRYYDHRFPLSLDSYAAALTLRLPESRSRRRHPALSDLRRLVAAFQDFDRAQRAMGEGPRLRRRKLLKRRLWRIYRTRAPVRRLLDERLRLLNGTPGRPRSFDRLDRILAAQHYRLAFWQDGREEINYRRFFDVNELVGVRVEEPRVFERRHARVAELARKGLVTGLRVDHVDGLYDPLQYLQRLQRRLLASAPRGAAAGGFYVAVEKILSAGEALRSEWPACGTTGYEFLSAAGGVFLDPEGLARLREIFAGLTGRSAPLAEQRRECKLLAMREMFPAEVRRLAAALARLAAGDRYARSLPEGELQRALEEVSAALPVYRTYVRGPQLAPEDRALIEEAVEAARRRLPRGRSQALALSFLQRVLLLEGAGSGPVRAAWLRFVMTWQQTTGPFMAKGLEDTAFYRHAPLLSLNEVGGDPDGAAVFADPAVFHRWNAARAGRWRHTLNATTTHDTKRGEDARARIHLLSEAPGLWGETVARWRAANQPKKTTVAGNRAPDAAEELFLYQSLIGVWPLDCAEEASLPGRLGPFVRKAAREAKLHTSWLVPDEEYEAALLAFAEALLADGAFVADMRGLVARMGPYAALHSVGEVVLKAASPGVPDFYQGSELWDLSLVDPDNRRPVDFDHRARALAELRAAEGRSDRAAFVARLAACWRDGRIKLHVTSRALALRRAFPQAFLAGRYVPLEVEGPRAAHVVAFARCAGRDWIVAAVGRWLFKLAGDEDRGVSAADWAGTALALPAAAPARYASAITGERIEAAPSGNGRRIRLDHAFATLPVALLHTVSRRTT